MLDYTRMIAMTVQFNESVHYLHSAECRYGTLREVAECIDKLMANGHELISSSKGSDSNGHYKWLSFRKKFNQAEYIDTQFAIYAI